MKKMLALLLLVPVLSLALAPIAAVSAQIPNHPDGSTEAAIYVHCDSYEGGPASVAVVYEGHYVHVACNEEGDDYTLNVCLSIHSATKYSVTASTDGVTYTWSGKLGPNWGLFDGHQYGPFGDYAAWSLSSPDDCG